MTKSKIKKVGPADKATRKEVDDWYEKSGRKELLKQMVMELKRYRCAKILVDRMEVLNLIDKIL